MASQGYEEGLLHHWFPPTGQDVEPRNFAERDIREISTILERAGKPAWGRVPRLYIVLRLIDKLDAIDSFVQQGVSDTWFPFDQRSLPERLHGHSDRANFLQKQKIVCNTKALNLERTHAGHGHFTDPAEVPLRKVGDLGKGSSGFVERVVSTISHREYALKRIRRGATFRKDKQVLRDFENELSNLKTLSRGHIHIIEVMGSFTEPKYVGILFPVADCNLAEILDHPDIQSQRWSLRAYFGCLASALGFLHDNNIRHKDIKPQNILIKDDAPYFTDFGVSIDWTEYGQSTTIGPTAMTPRYCAPEVAACEPRNTSSDIWSLGCVFLEMYAALKGATSKDLVDHFTRHGQVQPYHSSNPPISTWIEQLRGLATPHSDNLPISWIKHMVAPKRDDRWSAHLIVEQIRECSMDPSARFLYIGRCCLDNDDTAESVNSYDEPSVENSEGATTGLPMQHEGKQDILSSTQSVQAVNGVTETLSGRPSHPNIICQYCTERPEGFHNTHELDRHVARAHATRRKGYICVDFSTDKQFLASCKHCRNKKVYLAYYNAAAHLRRAHFHPPKHSMNGRPDEGPGGIGSGDYPSMEYLKMHWIKEVEIDEDMTVFDSWVVSKLGSEESALGQSQRPWPESMDATQKHTDDAEQDFTSSVCSSTADLDDRFRQLDVGQAAPDGREEKAEDTSSHPLGDPGRFSSFAGEGDNPGGPRSFHFSSSDAGPDGFHSTNAEDNFSQFMRSAHKEQDEKITDRFFGGDSTGKGSMPSGMGGGGKVDHKVTAEDLFNSFFGRGSSSKGSMPGGMGGGSKERDRSSAGEKTASKPKVTLEVITEYSNDGGGHTDIPKALLSQETLEAVLTVPYMVHDTVYRVARPMTEQKVERLIQVCRASVRQRNGKGDDSDSRTTSDPVPYVYRIGKTLETESNSKPKAAMASDRTQPPDALRTASLETLDSSDADDGTIRMLLDRSNVSHDMQMGCTKFEKHFVLASAIKELGYEFSEDSHFFCVTGYLDWNQQYEVVRKSRDRIRRLGQTSRGRSENSKPPHHQRLETLLQAIDREQEKLRSQQSDCNRYYEDDSRASSSGNLSRNKSERNTFTPSPDRRQTVPDTLKKPHESTYQEYLSSSHQEDRSGSPMYWYHPDNPYQQLPENSVPQRPRVPPVQHHSYGSTTSFSPVPHATTEYVPIYDEPRTMSYPPMYKEPANTHDPHDGYQYAQDIMDDDRHIQRDPRMPSPTSEQWGATPPLRPGYVPIYLLHNDRPTFSGWRKIHPSSDPYSAHPH
ncbi:hypothetical protein DE146DRAFT_628961 [Phaeosphaeria sp. MPI-PUGE-AT-0046c]|nr:hypothetical protein DE146DRAFT_628961 [Phaeosphaeria sp. MPI-PUGE-AT-0046c]